MPYFFSENLVFFGTLLSKCSALLAGDLQKSYSVCQILPLLYRFTDFLKIKYAIVMQSTQNFVVKYPVSFEKLQFLSRDVL